MSSSNFQTGSVQDFQTLQIPIDLPELPSEYPDYSSVDYWNKRFTAQVKQDFRDEGLSDWYIDFETMKPLLKLLPPLDENDETYNPDSEILMVGCGDSSLGQKIYKHLGFEFITNLDFSPVLITQMKQFMDSEGS
jgi:hypothetical protein